MLSMLCYGFGMEEKKTSRSPNCKSKKFVALIHKYVTSSSFSSLKRKFRDRICISVPRANTYIRSNYTTNIILFIYLL